MADIAELPRDDENDRGVETHDDDNLLTPGFVRSVLDSLENGEREETYALVQQLHNADIADLFEIVPNDQRAVLAVAIGDLVSAEVLAEVNDYVRDDIIDALPAARVAGLAGQLETDDAVAIIEEMDDADQQAVLAELEPEDRAAIESALSFPEESAGRIMQRDLVAVPEHITVGQLIDYLREGGDLSTEFWEIFVVDPQHRPIGTCHLSWILRTPRDIPLSDVMKREQTLIPVGMDQEEVAQRFQKYALISAAVIDDAGRLIGVITADDIVHIISDEAGEDILLLSGAGEGDINEPLRETYSARVRWLVANLGTAMVASGIIWAFGAAIETMVALAILMPIVASIGGNAGTQTMAVAVRALAMNQLTRSNTARIVWREVRVALMNGATIAVLIGIGTWLAFGNPMLGGVIACAMLFNVLISGLAGVMVPIILDRLDQDPAVASSVFVTMITDSMGFLIFLGLAVASGLVG
ncbi:MAG: magnesium transporter [Novosphingopyxis baekryungensis]|jgi:magnesium transporter|nr:magnesium transporter [Novosphingopyxis baekryungensis]